ncbi:MAG: hypothetical protein QNJ32_04870 [Xenococcaceae cyanobacterium MO_167.B27]|nr:hypothetical protein [Xenococcaceae cyanobacterium MO_167.B27]
MIINRYIMIQLLSCNLIACILVLSFPCAVKPINVSEQAIEKEKQALPMFKVEDQPLYNLDQVPADRSLEALNLSNLADRYYNNQNYFMALNNIDRAIAIVEQIRSNIASKDLRNSFFTQVKGYYKLKTVILTQLNQQKPNKGYDVLAFETSEQGKARSLLELLQEANIDIRKGVAPEFLAEEKEIKIKLDAIERKRISLCNRNCSQRLLTQLETERSQLLEQYKQIQAKIRANSPEYAKLTQPEPIKLKELQQFLDEDTVLWQYSLWRDQSYVWVITKDSFTTHELASRQEIETVAREYHKLLQYETN